MVSAGGGFIGTRETCTSSTELYSAPFPDFSVPLTIYSSQQTLVSCVCASEHLDACGKIVHGLIPRYLHSSQFANSLREMYHRGRLVSL